MRYHVDKRRPRKRKSTPIENFPDKEVKKWWGISIRRGVAIVVSRIADEIVDGTLPSISFEWNGGDRMTYNCGDERGCVQLDARVCDIGVYEKRNFEDFDDETR